MLVYVPRARQYATLRRARSPCVFDSRYWTSQTVHTPSPLKNGLVRILVYNPGREDVVLIVVTASSSLKSGERTGLITL